MAEGIIFRNPTDSEKKDFTDLFTKQRNYERMMRLKISEMETDYLGIRHIPFCRRCAKAEFDDAYDRLKVEIQRSRQPMDAVQERVKDLQINLDDYAKADLFEFIGESPAMENRLIDGIKRQDVDGYYFGFRCKRRGCVIKIRVPREDCVAYRENIIPQYSISKDAKRRKDADDKRKVDLKITKESKIGNVSTTTVKG